MTQIIDKRKTCKIIGIAGNKGEGKDTTAGMIKWYYEKQGLNVRILHFADPIKHGLSTMLNVDTSYFFDQSLKEKPLFGFDKTHTPRFIMQFVGTNVFQKLFGKSVWCNSLHHQITTQRYTELYDVILIPDVRFKSEIDFIKNRMGGHMIFLKRQGLNQFKSFKNQIHYLFSDLFKHSSERWIYNMFTHEDFWICNDGNFAKLKEECIAFCKRYHRYEM